MRTNQTMPQIAARMQNVIANREIADLERLQRSPLTRSVYVARLLEQAKERARRAGDQMLAADADAAKKAALEAVNSVQDPAPVRELRASTSYEDARLAVEHFEKVLERPHWADNEQVRQRLDTAKAALRKAEAELEAARRDMLGPPALAAAELQPESPAEIQPS